MTKAERQAARKDYFKKKNPIAKWKRWFENIRKFIVGNPDYMILLVQLTAISLMYEEYGFTKTLPIVLISSFLLGTFYGYRKRIMIHTFISILILTSVSQDFELSSHVIILGLLLTFAGIYAARFLERYKSQNIIRNLIEVVITLILVALSIFGYMYRFGTPLNYSEAKKSIENYIIQNDKNQKLYYRGLTYDYDAHAYRYECVNADKINEDIIYTYNVFTKEIEKEFEENDLEIKEEVVEAVNEAIDNNIAEAEILE